MEREREREREKERTSTPKSKALSAIYPSEWVGYRNFIYKNMFIFTDWQSMYCIWNKLTELVVGMKCWHYIANPHNTYCSAAQSILDVANGNMNTSTGQCNNNWLIQMALQVKIINTKVNQLTTSQQNISSWLVRSHQKAKTDYQACHFSPVDMLFAPQRLSSGRPTSLFHLRTLNVFTLVSAFSQKTRLIK